MKSEKRKAPSSDGDFLVGLPSVALAKDGGGARIRTLEGVSQQIYREKKHSILLNVLLRGGIVVVFSPLSAPVLFGIVSL